MNADQDDPETYAIIGAAMEVHVELGNGFLENVYHEALARELTDRGIPYSRETDLSILYKGQTLPCTYRADFICSKTIVVELKAISTLTSVDEAQLLNYLKVTGIRRGLLINFGSPRLQVKRKVVGFEEMT